MKVVKRARFVWRRKKDSSAEDLLDTAATVPKNTAIEQWGSSKEKLLPRSRGRSGCTEQRRENSVVIAFPFPNTV